VRVTHRFHPLFGRELEFVKRRRNYGDDVVYVRDPGGELLPLPAQWTDAVPADPFVETAAGRAPFRTEGECRRHQTPQPRVIRRIGHQHVPADAHAGLQRRVPSRGQHAQGRRLVLEQSWVSQRLPRQLVVDHDPARDAVQEPRPVNGARARRSAYLACAAALNAASMAGTAVSAETFVLISAPVLSR
jgi:hypothetical protein